MRWFRRRRRQLSIPPITGPEEGLALPLDDAEDLGRVGDLGAIFEAIQEALPEDAVLYLEGSRRRMPPELIEFLDANPAAERRLVAKGTIWPRSAKFHVAATRPNLDRLQQIEAVHAAPEICDHLVVYRGDDVLLTAYDAGSDWVYVSKRIGEPAIERMRQVFGRAR